MGIPGLTSFVRYTGNLWTTIDLHGTKLDIDGKALLFYLYENRDLDCRCGVQYDEFYQAVVAFFVSLKSRRVDSFVVFDGAIDPSGKKLMTIKKRVKDSLKTANKLSISADNRLFLIPLLSAHVFKQQKYDISIRFLSLFSAWLGPKRK